MIAVPKVGELYRSNRGRGKYVARVVAIEQGLVQLAYEGLRRGQVFRLSLWFFQTRSGWRRV